MKSGMPGSADDLLQDPQDFSLVLGGPLFQLMRRSHLADDALLLVRRRIVVHRGHLLVAAPGARSSRGPAARRECVGALPGGCRSSRSLPRCSTAADRCGDRRPPAHAQRGQAVPRASLDSRQRDDALRCSDRCGLPTPQFATCRGPVARLRVCGRDSGRLATVRCARHGHVVRDSIGRRAATLACGNVVWLRELAYLPVLADPLVLSYFHLGAVSLARIAHRVAPGANASGPRRRAGVSAQHRLRVRSSCCWRMASYSPETWPTAFSIWEPICSSSGSRSSATSFVCCKSSDRPVDHVCAGAGPGRGASADVEDFTLTKRSVHQFDV